MTETTDRTPIGNGVAPRPDSGRDSRGRFAPGNAGGPGRRPGNQFTRQLARRRELVLEEVDEQKLRQLIRALLAQAQGGDVAAAKLLLSYAVGKPAPAVDVDGVDQDEFDRLNNWPTHPEVLRALLDGADPGLAAAWLAAGQPADLAEFMKKVVKGCKGSTGARRILLAQQRRAGEKVAAGPAGDDEFDDEEDDDE